jgi:hypothetical protein
MSMDTMRLYQYSSSCLKKQNTFWGVSPLESLHGIDISVEVDSYVFGGPT